MRAPDPIIHSAYWHSGGEIIGAGGVVLTRDHACDRLAQHQMQAFLAGDDDARARHDRASSELRSAIEAADRWARAARPLSPLAA